MPYRIGEVERRLARIEEKSEALPTLKANSETLARDLLVLADEVRALRRAIVTAAISFAGSALVIAVSVLIALK